MIWVGIGIAMSSNENHKRRSIGWLIVAIATLTDGICTLLQSRPIHGVIILVIAVVDFWLYSFWRKKYKDSLVSEREKFLDEIMESRKI